jgi:MarR family transcriptional regulator
VIIIEDFLSLKNQLCFAVYETSGEFTKLYTSVLQHFGITYPQYLVLLALWENDGLTFKELGNRLNLGTGTLTPMITRMVAKGWLRKERSTTDERNVYIHLQQKSFEEKLAITQKVGAEIQSCHIDLEEYLVLMQQLHTLNMKLKYRTSRGA